MIRHAEFDIKFCPNKSTCQYCIMLLTNEPLFKFLLYSAYSHILVLLELFPFHSVTTVVCGAMRNRA